ncbi:2-iminobutanoate/2-iminopropanoate deaminase [Spiroplasma chinense]|uniref:2-iminobutanoate/2-iminopropanoate deaminase n=1 Tax=Spiroplasma chinense TaxID=216932 RepID=A0A5B9Y3D7_9MOLU|nr:RidA family protein [Spiroplasma chinense]QEH61648.1 2-iminobutanoate/2-iminopropanoate deaminase [Spiroplasma chinense]
MKNKIINSEKAPKAIGPYSQAIMANNGTLYISGQLPINPETGEFISNDVKEQTLQSLKNAQAILQEAGMDIENVCKTTVFLSDIKDFVAMNEVYSEFFGNVKPARSAFEVANLPKDAKVEIEMIAF